MEGKVALVTGGAQGIGKSYCRELLKYGAKVVVCDNDEKMSRETFKEFQSQFNDRVVYYICDVTNPDQFEGCFKEALKKFGGLDILINNAGICDEREGCWKRMIDVNLVSLVQGIKMGFKYMSRNSGGRGGLIVNIASITSLEPWECIPVYSATKAAVNQLSRSYGTDLHFKNSGVKVIAINPGLTDTKILDDVRNLCVSEEAKLISPKAIEAHPVQEIENMGKGMIQVIKTAANGSLWTIEDDKPPHLTIIQ